MDVFVGGMPEGPLGLPRLTSIGPFSNTEAAQEFSRERGVALGWGDVDREVSNAESVSLNDAEGVEAKLTIREELPDEEPDGVLDRIRNEVDVATRDETVATVTYWLSGEVAKIKYIEVDGDFRQMGVGTRMKEIELGYMEEQGVEVVYTDIVSEGGYRLAKRTGFRPIHEADHLRGTEIALHFGDRRGVMFKYL